jgi:hypothetical protein
MDTASSAVTLPTKRTVVPVAVPIVAESVAGSTVGDPAATRQQQQQQDVSTNVDSNKLKLQLAALENEHGYLKVEVSDVKFSGTSLFHSLSLKLACLFIFIFH